MTKNLITRMNKKKLAPLRAKNDVTHAIQLKLHERMNKKWLKRHMVVTTFNHVNEQICSTTSKK